MSVLMLEAESNRDVKSFGSCIQKRSREIHSATETRPSNPVVDALVDFHASFPRGIFALLTDEEFHPMDGPLMTEVISRAYKDIPILSLDSKYVREDESLSVEAADEEPLVADVQVKHSIHACMNHGSNEMRLCSVV